MICLTLEDEYHTAIFVVNKVISLKTALKEILNKLDNSSVTNVANLVILRVIVLTLLQKIVTTASIVVMIDEIIDKCQTKTIAMTAMIVVVMRVIREHVTSAVNLVILPGIVQIANQQIAIIVAIEVIT